MMKQSIGFDLSVPRGISALTEVFSARASDVLDVRLFGSSDRSLVVRSALMTSRMLSRKRPSRQKVHQGRQEYSNGPGSVVPGMFDVLIISYHALSVAELAGVSHGYARGL
jgi:hypothetical protein